MSNEYQAKKLEKTSFTIFCDGLRGKTILRRDNHCEVHRYEVFSERTFKWLMEDLLQDRHEKYYLVNKKSFIPASWRETEQAK